MSGDETSIDTSATSMSSGDANGDAIVGSEKGHDASEDTDSTTPATKPSQSSDERYVMQSMDFLDSVFASYPRRDFAFRLWDGTLWQKKPTPPPPSSSSSSDTYQTNVNGEENTVVKPKFTVVLNHAAALRRMFLPPSDDRFGLAYTLGDFDIEGDTGGALDLGRHLWETWRWYDIFISAFKLIRLPSSPNSTSSHMAQLSGSVHSENRDRNAIQFHYDMGNDFYQLWLDSRMVYSCGYFKSPQDSIEDAQLNKLDIICRKLRLRRGETLLDIGCGWGALAIHAAKHYGARVTGVTLSEEQVKLGRQRVASENLSDAVSIKLCDYRQVDGQFDKIVSVGMVEHVGRSHLHEYFSKAYALLRPGGVFLNHGITLLHDNFKSPRQVRNGFFARYIFPDGDLQPLPYILKFVADANFEIRDIETLREHYELTLQRWTDKFLASEKEVVQLVGRETFRLWKLYLLAAGWGFKVGLHGIYQTLLFKADESRTATPHLPLTRDDWYIPAEEQE